MASHFHLDGFVVKTQFKNSEIIFITIAFSFSFIAIADEGQGEILQRRKLCYVTYVIFSKLDCHQQLIAMLR